ncbi:MAG: hypothetical protein U0Q03_06960 [Acidimicrobiales bacterium]
MLIPAADSAADLLRSLATRHRAGSREAWPEAARVVERMLADDVDGATVRSVTTGRAIDRLVLAPSTDAISPTPASRRDDANLLALSRRCPAKAGSDEPPSVEGVDGEFAVLALTVRAARGAQFKDPAVRCARSRKRCRTPRWDRC